MTEFCSYHPTQPAWWQCQNCAKYLCPQCIIQRKGGYFGNESIYLCPKCNVNTIQLDAANIVQPFWRRLHKCFVYPFSSVQSIALILGMALLSALFSGESLFGVMLRFIPWAIMVKYSYEALRFTSQGRFRPPPLSSEVISKNFGIVIKQIALFIALSFIFGLFITRLNPFLWILFGLAVLIGLPSMIIILAINDNLTQALNPLYFLGMAIRIGWGYLLLFFFLALLLSAPSALAYAVIQHLPDSLQMFVWMAAKNYYTLVSYHLMGYVILQYHDRLNYHVDIDTLMTSTYPTGLLRQNSEKQTAALSESKSLLSEVSPLIQEGNLEGAIGLIRQRTGLKIHDVELSDRYLTLLKICKREKEFIDYAPHHLDLLVKTGDKSSAMALCLKCFQKDKAFAASPTALFKMGSWFNENGNPKMAIQSWNHLTKIHPADALVPKAYYRAAQILHEKLMNTDKAKKILNALISRYPDHEISNFARTYLKGI